MQCTTGGFIHKRHDGVKDIVAKMLDSVAYDVQIEPALQPLTGEVLPRSANSDDEGRLDISARGFWQRGDKAFFDVRIFNPFAKSHLPVKLKTLFAAQETAKKRDYNEGVLRVEHGSFTPIVMSAYGGFRRETRIRVGGQRDGGSQRRGIPKVKFRLFSGSNVTKNVLNKTFPEIRNTHGIRSRRCQEICKTLEFLLEMKFML